MVPAMPIDPAKPFDLAFTVDPTWGDLRLDQFVKAMVPALSRTKIQRYVKQDRIEVNGQPRPANWRVRLGDRVLLRCHVPEEGADAADFEGRATGEVDLDLGDGDAL